MYYWVFFIYKFDCVRWGSILYWWRQQEYPEEATYPQQVTDKLYHIFSKHDVITIAEYW